MQVVTGRSEQRRVQVLSSHSRPRLPQRASRIITRFPASGRDPRSPPGTAISTDGEDKAPSGSRSRPASTWPRISSDAVLERLEPRCRQPVHHAGGNTRLLFISVSLFILSLFIPLFLQSVSRGRHRVSVSPGSWLGRDDQLGRRNRGEQQSGSLGPAGSLRVG